MYSMSEGEIKNLKDESKSWLKSSAALRYLFKGRPLGQCAFSFIFWNKGGKFPVALPRGDGQGPGLLLQILKDTELDRADLHS